MKEVLGNTDGLKNNIIESLLQLYELKVPPWQLVSAEIVIHMAKITTAVNREVNIFLETAIQFHCQTCRAGGEPGD